MNAYTRIYNGVNRDCHLYLHWHCSMDYNFYKYPNGLWFIILGMDLPVVFDSQETHRNN